MKSKIATLFWIGIIFLYIAGVVHSFMAHSKLDFAAALFLPPWTLWRGLEMFWHKD